MSVYEDRIFAGVLAPLREERLRYESEVSGGACADFAQYQKLCGVIQGLMSAEQHIKAFAEKFGDQDE